MKYIYICVYMKYIYEIYMKYIYARREFRRQS